MEARKNPKYDVEKRRPMFFFMSLCIVMSLVIAAFEWKTEDPAKKRIMISENVMMEEVLEIKTTYQKPPPPPKVQSAVIKEVSDEEDLSHTVEIKIDMEVTEDTKVDNTNYDMNAEPVEEAFEEEVVEDVFMIVETMPKPIGGYAGFYSFIAENINYPKDASRMDIQGKIFVQFVVNKHGEISEAKVVKGIGFGCDEEALRVIALGYNWNPGMQRGKAVNVRMVLPIVFKLDS